MDTLYVPLPRSYVTCLFCNIQECLQLHKAIVINIHHHHYRLTLTHRQLYAQTRRITSETAGDLWVDVRSLSPGHQLMTSPVPAATPLGGKGRGQRCVTSLRKSIFIRRFLEAALHLCSSTSGWELRDEIIISS